MSCSPIAYSVSRKRKRTQLDDRSPSHKSARHSFGVTASSSGVNSQPTAPIRQDEELGNQVRTGRDALYDGDVGRRADEFRHVEARQNQEPPTSNNAGALVISPSLQLEIPFQFFAHTFRQQSLSTASCPIEAYSTTLPTTPSRPLRSPKALAIWAGIVGVPPPLPDFGQSTPATQLPPTDPICLISLPNLDHIWNALPTGTFWEFARLAQDETLDVNNLSETMLVTALIGDRNTRKRSNIEGVEAIRLWANDSKLSKEDLPWLQELDWEAEAIVEDKGRMLGIGVDGDTGDNNEARYGGRVGFCATLHCEKGQRRALNLKVYGRIVLEKPMMRGSCLFTRIWGSHRFLRLKLPDGLLNRVGNDETGQLRKELQDYCSRPIHILGRRYHPLVEKENVVYYFQHGQDRVGSRAMEDLGRTRKFYGVGKYIGTVEGLLQWWLVPEHNRNQAMSKLTARLHLGLSDTLPGVFIKPENVKIVPDITRNGFKFTDGAGLASGSIAIACWRRYHPGDHSTSPAIQIRFSSAKGVVQVDPKDAETSNFNGPYKITLTESMVKVKYNPHRRPANGPVHGMSIYDAAHYIVCIVKPAPIIFPTRLSGQYMTILSARGVPDEVFLELQRDSVKEALKVIGDVHKWWDSGSHSRAGINGRMQLAAALETAGGLAISVKKRDTAGAARGLGIWRPGDDRLRRKGTQDTSSRAVPAASSDESSRPTGIPRPTPAANDTWRRDEVSGYPLLKCEALRVATLQGLDIARNNHLSSLWTYTVHDVIRRVVLDLHLPVPRSAGGFLQPDWTGTLQEGEIVFIPAEGVVDPDTGFALTEIVGDVVVGRHPALLPTDMRKVRAIHPPLALRHCRGLIIFSTQGCRPLADILAGGDYDGDLGDVIWEPKIVDTFQNAPLDLSKAPPDVDSCFEKDTVSVDELLEHFKYIPEQEHVWYFSQQLLLSTGEPGLFKWYSGMYNKAAIQYGIDHAITQDLAHKFNKLMDASKSGIRIKPPKFRHDKAHWDKKCDPYWKYQQRTVKSVTHQDPDSTAMCYSAPASKFVLDVLVDVGSGFLKEQVEAFKAQLQIYQNAEFNSICQSKAQDEDLTQPWFEALRWAEDEPDRMTRDAKQAELYSIQDSVNECLNRFMQMIACQIAKKKPTNQRQEEIGMLVRHYAKSPDLRSLPLLTTSLPGGDVHVGRIKASYAYLQDSERYQAKKGQGGGSPSGFPWQMAMAELGDIKAEAISRGDTIRLPYNVIERVGVHRYFK